MSSITTNSDSAELLAAQNRLLELTARGAPIRAILDLLCRTIQLQCPGMLCSVLLLDQNRARVRHGAAPDLPDAFIQAVDGEPIGPKAGSCGTAAFRREPVIVEDIQTDPLWDDYRDLALRHGLRACWSTPILDADASVLGTFAMYFREPGRPSLHHLRLIEISTHIASIAIAKHRVEEMMRRREAQLSQAEHIASLGSYEWDVRTNEVHRSEELCRIYGLPAHEFEPTYEGYLARVHPDDRDRTRRVIDQAFRNREPFDFEERIVRPDGAVRTLHSLGDWSFDDAQRPVRLIGICQDVSARKQVEQELRAANEALEAELRERKRAENEIRALSARLIDAQEAERGRLARELHDGVCQEIAAISIGASQLKKRIGPEYAIAAGQCERVQQQLIHLAETIRDLSHNLHPVVLEHAGLPAALQSYCAEIGDLTGLAISFRFEGSSIQVARPVALCVYRVAQEAIQNVLKHAGVKDAQLILHTSDEVIRLTISDQGTGFDLSGSTHGLGLLSMRERARLVNGKMRVTSKSGQGTTLEVVIPTK